MNPCTVLYAEDEETDIFFLQRAFQLVGSPHNLNTVVDGEDAIEYLIGGGPFADRACYPLPALVLLDISMPKKSGLEVLEWIRQQSHFQSLPVIILTSSSRQEDLQKARELGAEDYLIKPADPRKLVLLVETIHNHLAAKPVAQAHALI